MVSFREANRSMIGNGRPFFKIGFLLFCCELSTFFSELYVLIYKDLSFSGIFMVILLRFMDVFSRFWFQDGECG